MIMSIGLRALCTFGLAGMIVALLFSLLLPNIPVLSGSFDDTDAQVASLSAGAQTITKHGGAFSIANLIVNPSTSQNALFFVYTIVLTLTIAIAFFVQLLRKSRAPPSFSLLIINY